MLMLDVAISCLVLSYAISQLNSYVLKHKRIACPNLILGDEVTQLLQEKIIKIKVNTLIVIINCIFSLASLLILIFFFRSQIRIAFHLSSHIGIVTTFSGFMINSISSKLQKQYTSCNITFKETNLTIHLCKINKGSLGVNYLNEHIVKNNYSISSYYVILNPWNNDLTSNSLISIGAPL